MKADPLKLRIAAGMGFLAVALGAVGAHALEARLEAAHRTEMWKTAALYHLTHSIVLLVLAIAFPWRREGRWTFGSLLLGVTLFSGSLYTYSLTGQHWLVFVTPVGGMLMLLGWALLALRKWS